MRRGNKKQRKIHNGELHNFYVRSNSIQGRHIKEEMCAKTVLVLALQAYIKMYLEIPKETNHLRNLDVGTRIIIY